jgi:glycerol-3-phosphate dehydrogenase (NAD(P)+)
MFDKIGVVGSGGWGCALASLLAQNGNSVTLWSHTPSVAEEINSRHTNERYLPGISFPEKIRATPVLGDLRDADLLIFVVPSTAIRTVALEFAATCPKPGTVVVSCTKGIEHNSGKLMSQVLEECLPAPRMAALSGPNLALEVAAHIPAASVIGSTHTDLLSPLQNIFSSKSFRAYTSDDIAGIQLGGALKNVYAIAAGVCDGFGMGDNAKAALVTRSLAEMTRLGIALGGRMETFFGLSGVGDLMVTCFSTKSRNRSFGERLGHGERPVDIMTSLSSVAEGVPTALSAWQCANRFGIDAPITTEVYSVLHTGKPPKDSMAGLLGRPPKPENGLQPPHRK